MHYEIPNLWPESQESCMQSFDQRTYPKSYELKDWKNMESYRWLMTSAIWYWHIERNRDEHQAASMTVQGSDWRQTCGLKQKQLNEIYDIHFILRYVYYQARVYIFYVCIPMKFFSNLFYCMKVGPRFFWEKSKLQIKLSDHKKIAELNSYSPCFITYSWNEIKLISCQKQNNEHKRPEDNVLWQVPDEWQSDLTLNPIYPSKTSISDLWWVGSVPQCIARLTFPNSLFLCIIFMKSYI